MQAGKNSDNNSMVGGIVGGSNCQTTTNCYNRGSITGAYNGGGGISGGTDPGITISNCYNTGTITVSTGASKGSIAGYSWGTEKSYFTNCWATTSLAIVGTKDSGAQISGGGVNQSAANMKAKTSTLGSAFKNDYTGSSSINDGYPILTWE